MSAIRKLIDRMRKESKKPKKPVVELESEEPVLRPAPVSCDSLWLSQSDTEPCKPSAPMPTLPRPSTRRQALPVSLPQDIPNSTLDPWATSPDVNMFESSSLEGVLQSIRQMNSLYPALSSNDFSLSIPEDEPSVLSRETSVAKIMIQSSGSPSYRQSQCTSCKELYTSDDLYCCISCGLDFCILCAEMNKTEKETKYYCRRCLVFRIQNLPLVPSVLEQLYPSDLQWYLAENHIVVDSNLSKLQLIDAIKQLQETLSEPVDFASMIDLEPDTHNLFAGLERQDSLKQSNLAKIDDGEEDKLCKICMDEMVNCALVECGHMLCCEQCGRQIDQCPICRKPVKHVLRIYQA